MRKSVYLLSMVILYACGSNDKDADKNETNKSSAIVNSERQSSAFTQSATKLLNAYYLIKDALVEYDTVAANKGAELLITASDSLKMDDTKADSALVLTVNSLRGSISAESKGLIGETDITAKRRSFSMITENLYPLLQAIRYDGHIVYHQLCPMAFNDSETATWLSNSREIVNPYLGKKHPKYAAGMLHCGEVKDSLAYHP
jgi:Protein of unknown function (DUF3347)